MKALTELAKRRGFFFQSSEPYGGVAGFYTYGPHGAALKANVEERWRERFTVREGHTEIDAPTIMPEAVFEASGHLDTFDDMLVECAACGESHRADHLIEDETDIEEAESLPIPEVESLIREHEIDCPVCGDPLAGEPVESFNLMFETSIGPGSGDRGYLRPETAQGIFVDFPRLKEYARGELPFGVTQIGRAYRNEISPRNAIVRSREFTQAELEHFVDPEADEPDLESVADVEAPLYSAEMQQDGDGEPDTLTIGEAVDEGVIGDSWIAYYLGVARDWYEGIGVDMDRFRFRQHLPGELAHYSADCWDAEGDVSAPGEEPEWIELAGFSYRSDYDLSNHAEHSGERFTVFREYEEPKTVERATVDPDMAYLGPEFGGRAEDVAAALETLVERDRSAFEGETVTVDVDGESVDVPLEKTGFSVDDVTENGRHITPHVVEPSFGVDRAVFTVLVHAYEEDVVDEEERTVLRLPPSVSPTTVGVFPLMDKDGLGERARSLAENLRAAGFSVTDDDAGGIGRRYRRQDEIGTPFGITVDYETIESDTVTLRDRDSTAQRRLPVDDLTNILAALRDGERTFESLEADYPPAE